MQLKQAISSVLETTKQETDIYDRWLWVEASILSMANRIEPFLAINIEPLFQRKLLIQF